MTRIQFLRGQQRLTRLKEQQVLTRPTYILVLTTYGHENANIWCLQVTIFVISSSFPVRRKAFIGHKGTRINLSNRDIHLWHFAAAQDLHTRPKGKVRSRALWRVWVKQSGNPTNSIVRIMLLPSKSTCQSCVRISLMYPKLSWYPLTQLLRMANWASPGKRLHLLNNHHKTSAVAIKRLHWSCL